MKIKATDDFLRDLHQPADKCLVVGEPEMLVPLEEKLRQELGKRINVYRSEAFYLELVPKGIDKAASLSRLLERTRIKQVRYRVAKPVRKVLCLSSSRSPYRR